MSTTPTYDTYEYDTDDEDTDDEDIDDGNFASGLGLDPPLQASRIWSQPST